MEADSLRGMFDAVLPVSRIREAVERLGVVRRQRSLDPVALVYSLVLMGGTWESGRIATVVRDYFERGGKKVVPGAYYKWFDDELLALMKELSACALSYADAMPKHLPGILAGRLDWRAVDSTVVRLPDELAAVYPGTGEYASLKVHKEYSLGVENIVGYHITPGRRHDGPELVVDERRRGTGLIVDLAYAGTQLLRDCQRHDVQLVLRLKSGWKVYVDELADRSGWVGADSVDEDASEPLDLSGLDGLLDLDVTVGPDNDPVSMRLVGVPMAKEQGLFLTTVPRETHSAEEIGMLYRLRWSIEIDNKLSKTACQLDEITAERPVSAQILVHAAMIASVLANAIVHLDAVEQGAVGAKTVTLKRPPLHPILVWKCVVTGAHRMAEMLAAPDAQPEEWKRRAALLTFGGQDRNWKRKPSAMDRVKGRCASGRAWRSPRQRPRERVLGAK